MKSPGFKPFLNDYRFSSIALLTCEAVGRVDVVQFLEADESENQVNDTQGGRPGATRTSRVIADPRETKEDVKRSGGGPDHFTRTGLVGRDISFQKDTVTRVEPGCLFIVLL